MSSNPMTCPDRIAELASLVLQGQPLSFEQTMELTRVSPADIHDLFYWANRIRLKFVGPQVQFCSIVAAKVGACSEDCGYCSQSKHHHTHVKPSKMKVDEIESVYRQATDNGAASFGIVNSGRGPTERELDWMEPFLRHQSQAGQVRACVSLGELTASQVQRLKEMGVRRVHHNLETSRRNFPNIITTHSYDDRLETIRLAKEAGMSICSGGIFGMGEAWSDRIEMALELRRLGVDSVPINFLNQIEGTAIYGKFPALEPMEALQIISVYRFLLPSAELKVCGGRDKILRELVSWIFFAGASSFMMGNYLTTIGRTPEQDHQMLRDLGIPYVTFDEQVHQALPSDQVAQAPLNDGALAALPIVN